MTNEQVTELLRAAQQLWKKYRDDPPKYWDLDAIDRMVEDFAAPVVGLPERASHIMLFFVSEVYERSKARENEQ